MKIIERIKLILEETNPWWKEKDYSLKEYLPRDVFVQIEKFFSYRQIIGLIGLRRVGKTTLMLKAVETFLHKGKLSNKNIIYFSFDDFSSLDIEDILTAYSDFFPDIDLKKGKFLFCFDEIQKLQNWQEKIKRLYDIYPGIKIIVSGSESLFLRQKAKEHLGGRIFEFKINPLNFKEYLSFLGKENFFKNTLLYKQEILKVYKHYLKTSGFPELIKVKDNFVIYKYLKESILDKILFKDIPILFRVENLTALEDILDIIMRYPGQIIDSSKLAKELVLSRQSVSSYLLYLEKAFLIKKVYNFSKNLRKQKRALKKYYPAIIYPSYVEDKFSLCFENALIWQLNAQFFYRDAYKNEIDIIHIGQNKEIVPIEIKSGKINTAALKYFLRKYKLRKGLVLSFDTERKEDKVYILPFYKYILPQKRKAVLL